MFALVVQKPVRALAPRWAVSVAGGAAAALWHARRQRSSGAVSSTVAGPAAGGAGGAVAPRGGAGGAAAAAAAGGAGGAAGGHSQNTVAAAPPAAGHNPQAAQQQQKKRRAKGMRIKKKKKNEKSVPQTRRKTKLPASNSSATGMGPSSPSGVTTPTTTAAVSAAGPSTTSGAGSSISAVARRRGGQDVVGNKKKKPKVKRLRICVLNSSYKGTDSITAEVDDYHCSPAHYIKDKRRYVFSDVYVEKNDSYRTVRELVTGNRFDVFFNLCDGGKDEKRAGIDVVEALEEHNAAFTGTDSHSFEPSKIDMKLLVGAAGVNTPNFVFLENAEALAKKCRHLRFPLIVKHLSGYASVGIHKDNRCDNLDELKVKVSSFLREFNHALVEEFICGREGTVLACADAGSPFGVKVFRPLMFNFLQNDDDFAYFEKKWTIICDDNAYNFLPANDPAYPQIVEMARNAFTHIMNGVGYGRVDFRIDPKGDVYFLEINPNCGMWYSEADGGDFADLMVQGDKTWNHDRFIRNSILRAVREQVARRPWYFISHDSKGNFSTRASKTVRAGKSLFSDGVHNVPVVAKSLYRLGGDDQTVGCVIMRGDRLHQAVAIRHSCEPNMHFMQGCTLTLVSKRKINVGEELTVDYATLCDERMPPFPCSCGTSNCRSVIFPMPASPRTLEGKNMRQLLREKKRAWYKEMEEKKEDREAREAERMLKKRATKRKASANAAVPEAATGSGSHGTNSAHTKNNNNNNNSP